MLIHERRARLTAMLAAIAALLAAFAAPGAAQQGRGSHLGGFVSSSALPDRTWVLPQARCYTGWRPGPVVITKVDATVDIREQVATTTLDIHLHNPGPRRLESELLLPVPAGAAVRGFDFEGSAAEPTARVLPADEARRLYDEIVAKIKDPALLEFVGYQLVRSSVFPVEARGTQRVRLTYEHLLTADGDRVDYVLPRSESLEYRVPWTIDVRVRSTAALSTLYSPSHPIESRPTTASDWRARLASAGASTPGPFRLSYLTERDGVAASLIAYPDPSIGGGYFLLLGGVPSELSRAQLEAKVRRDVTLVVDRSGSMHGDKIEQVREAVLQILGGLEPGETFNVIPYNEAVESLAPSPVVKSKENLRAARDYVAGILPRGGTNIHDALHAALAQKPPADSLPIVLFLTDGLPTVGKTSEIAIRELATKANPYGKRVFTFGVGVDVNTPLLEKIASETRATATFVLPNQDVEFEVARCFDRLAGPVLSDPKLVVNEADGSPALGRVHDVLPNALPDLFRGDQIVLLGQYRGSGPLRFEIAGNYLGKSRRFEFRFDFDRATTKNAFVPRLWASRKIGRLIEAIRDLGAADAPFPMATPPSPQSDPRVRELVDEIVRLSTEFGILTEYTAFLATEGTELGDDLHFLNERATTNFWNRAMKTRSGLGSVNQSLNNMEISQRACLNPTNRFYDSEMNTVQVANVQQISDRAFYRRGNTWVDSRAIDRTQSPADRTIEFGSAAYRELLESLASHGRQGCLALSGDIVLRIGDETVRVKAPEAAAAPSRSE